MKVMQWLVSSALMAFFSAPYASTLEGGARVQLPCPLGDCSAEVSLSYLGEYSLPWDTQYDGIPFGGISGIDFDPATGHYWAISDDRSQKAPARLYELAIDIQQGQLKKVDVVRTIVLKDSHGQSFATGSVDPESVREGPDHYLYWTSEGSTKAGLPTVVRVADRDGRFVREFSTPEGFAPSVDRKTGIRENQAFEGLTILPSGDFMAGMETALFQDGPIASLTTGSLARFVRYDMKQGTPSAEYVYPISPIPQPPLQAPYACDNGVSEVLALDEHHLIVIERSFASGYGVSVKVFIADTSGATDVLQVPSLKETNQSIIPMRKSLLIDFRAIGLAPDNIEGVTLGRASDGSQVLIFASDDNFSPQQKNQFYAFKIERLPH